MVSAVRGLSLPISFRNFITPFGFVESTDMSGLGPSILCLWAEYVGQDMMRCLTDSCTLGQLEQHPLSGGKDM